MRVRSRLATCSDPYQYQADNEPAPSWYRKAGYIKIVDCEKYVVEPGPMGEEAK